MRYSNSLLVISTAAYAWADCDRVALGPNGPIVSDTTFFLNPPSSTACADRGHLFCSPISIMIRVNSAGDSINADRILIHPSMSVPIRIGSPLAYLTGGESGAHDDTSITVSFKVRLSRRPIKHQGKVDGCGGRGRWRSGNLQMWRNYP